MLRFKLEDLPPRLREQAERQLFPERTERENGSSTRQGHGKGRSERATGNGERARKTRPPITMKRKNEQSTAERRFNAEFLDGRGKFEALTLHLPGGTKYTADFFIADWTFFPDRPVLVEVKGSYRLQSHARAAAAFKTACACFPEFVFCWAEQQKDNTRWKVTFFRDGAQVGECSVGTADEILCREANGASARAARYGRKAKGVESDTSLTEGV